MLQGYGIFTGITLVALCLLHGATFIGLKTSGVLRDRADRFAQHDLTNCRRARWHDATVCATSFLRAPVDDIGCGTDFEPRFGEDLALLERHRARDRFRSFA